MTLLIISFVAGLLTVVSPCILPVLPFVFGRPGSLSMFGGLAVGFSVVLLLAIATSEWAAGLHQTGRTLSLIAMAVFGLSMAWPALGERLFKPLQALGQNTTVVGQSTGRWSGWILGASTGLLWAPCAGPVLGAVLSGSNVAGSSTAQTTLALLAFAAGAASSFLALRMAFGRLGSQLSARFKSLVAYSVAARRATGGLMVLGTILIASGFSDQIAMGLGGISTEKLEKGLLDQSTASGFVKASASAGFVLPDLGPMPSIQGGSSWIGSSPIRDNDLKGKVVLVEFWTFGCINCKRAIPYVQSWHKKYEKEGLVVIGIHTPEFAYERDRDNVQKAMKKMDLDFPVTLDNQFTVWNQWSNQYWPTLYLVDQQGRIRWRHIGEGAYKKTEEAIQILLREKNAKGT